MTQEEFDAMPVLMRPWMARRALGVGQEELRNVRSAKPDVATRLKGMKEWRYHKSVIARMTKLKMK